MICDNCPHKCDITETFTGFCKTRQIKDGKIINKNYGQVTALALDPIEKKPFKRFMPGNRILSVGFWGCNMKCPWCQNDSISRGETESLFIRPEELAAKALSIPDNIGLAYTYNEPFISFDYIKKTAEIVHAHGLKNVLVTNGMINDEKFDAIIPYIDALNVDLKTIDSQKYASIGGNLNTILNTIKKSWQKAHVEITTLIVPGFNDSFDEMEKLAETLSEISSEIVLHVTRFFPAGNMTDIAPTSLKLVYDMADIGRKYLKYVYEGNV